MLLECCDASLDYLYLADNHEKKCKYRLPTCDAMLQMAQGLKYLHSKGFIHCDLKPSSILIKKDNDQFQIKLCNFDASTPVQNNMQSMNDFLPVTNGPWTAPEFLADNDETGIKSNRHVFGSFEGDIWALGCIFFYFLQGGKHPFGSRILVNYNVSKGEAVNVQELIRSGKDNWQLQLIQQLIKHDPKTRMSLDLAIEELQRNI